MNPEQANYEQVKGNEDLIGLRAKIIQTENYCTYLHGAVGTIEDACGNLFLRFDDPLQLFRNCTKCGVYLTAEGYVIV